MTGDGRPLLDEIELAQLRLRHEARVALLQIFERELGRANRGVDGGAVGGQR